VAAPVVFNVAKGSIRHYFGLPAASDGLVVLLLKATGLVSDDVLADYADVAALLAGASDEADFTNYARKVLTSGVTITQDNTNNRVDIDIPDQTWSGAGSITPGPANNSLGKLVVAYDPDTTTPGDGALIPLVALDFVATTDGTNLVAEVNAAGLARAA
jgi:hypothetical protein